MKVKFLESAAIGGPDGNYAKGQIVELDAEQAKRQIASGAAMAYDDTEVHTAIEDHTEVRKAVRNRK